jgi:hypothetical protein
VDYWIFVFLLLSFIFSIGIRRIFGKILSLIADVGDWPVRVMLLLFYNFP